MPSQQRGIEDMTARKTVGEEKDQSTRVRAELSGKVADVLVAPARAATESHTRRALEIGGGPMASNAWNQNALRARRSDFTGWSRARKDRYAGLAENGFEQRAPEQADPPANIGVCRCCD